MRAVVCAPLRVEAAAVRGAAAPVLRTGMGPRRSVRARPVDAAVLVAGVAGGVDPAVRPGDVVVASEVHHPESGPVPCTSVDLLAAALTGLGLTVHIGPIVSVPTVRAGRPPADGVLAVDCESAWLAPHDAPFAVLRSIVDTADRPLWSPGVVPRGMAGLRALRRAVPAIDEWCAAVTAADRGVS